MAPAVGPTTALAMCAAAFVGWRVPSQRAQSLEPDEPEVPDSTMDNELSTQDTDAVLSGINISNDVCESAVVQEHIRQHQNTISESAMAHEFEFSDNLGDGAMDNDWEHGNGAIESAHGSKNTMLHDTSIPVDHEGSQNMPRSSMYPVVDCDDDSNSLCNSDSKKEFNHFDYESSFELLNGQGAVPRVPSEFAEKPEFSTPSHFSVEAEAVIHNNEFGSLTEFAMMETETAFEVKKPESNNSSDLSVESEAVIHNNEFRSLTEFALMETETISEVKEPEPNNSSDLSVQSEAVTHTDEFGSLTVAIMEKETISEVPQHRYDVLDNRADQDLLGPEDDVTSGWKPRIITIFEFLLWSWQACCTECRKVLSDDNLDKAFGVLHQQWHSCLAISRSVLGEELFLKVSEVMATWWQVVLLCVASLFDLALYGVFGRVLLRNVGSCCRRRTRREPVPAELDVADGERPISPSDEQIETARSGTPQVPAPIDDVQRESACKGECVDAMKSQRSPFSAIQIHNVPTPSRRVAAVGFPSRQNMVATSISAERA